MEYFSFFMNVFQKEVTKSNLNFKKIIAYNAELNAGDGVFEIPYNRCAYVYKYATCSLSFIKNCITNFLNEYSDLQNLLLMWKSYSDMQMCSFSCGPGLDYLAFTLALCEFVALDLVPIFKEVNIVSKSSQWKSTLNSVVESIGCLQNFPISTLCEKFNVINDPLQKFSVKHNAAVKNSHVIFMVKTLNLQSPGAFEDQKTYFKELIDAMNTDSILFCIDTKPSITLMAQVLYHVPGEYLYGPFLNNTFRLSENFPEIYKEIYGCLPVISARGAFFVWKKLSVHSRVINVYPPALAEKAFKNAEAKSTVDNVSYIMPIFDVSPISKEKFLPNLSFKPDDFNTNEVIRVKEYVELLKNTDCNLKNVAKDSNNPELLVDKYPKLNLELSSLLQQYYNLNKNPSMHTEQLEDTFISKMPQKNHSCEVELDVSILLSDICDVVSEVNNSNKEHSTDLNYNPLENEFPYPELAVSEQKNYNELSNHNFRDLMFGGTFSKNDYKDEKLNLTQISNNLPLDNLAVPLENETNKSQNEKLNFAQTNDILSQDNFTEPLENETTKLTLDNCSDISQISNTVEKTKSVKKKRRRKSKVLQNSTLISNTSNSNTSLSTSSLSVNCKSDSMKTIKLTNVDNHDINKSLTNSEKINTKLKIPVSNMQSIDSVVNVIPNISVSKKSVQCGTDSVHKNTDSSSIEDLTNRIKKLVASFETALTQNQQLQNSHGNVCGNSLNCFCFPRTNSILSSNDSPIDVKPNFQVNIQNLNPDVPVKGLTDKRSPQSSDINDQQTDSRIPHSTCGTNASMDHTCGICPRQMHCCANMCSRIQTCTSHMHGCPCCTLACPIRNCHHCGEQRFLHCNCSLGMHSLQSHTNLSVPNIVIPLQNVSDDAIAQIISALRARS